MRVAATRGDRRWTHYLDDSRPLGLRRGEVPDQRRLGTRRPLTGPRSISSESTSPTTGQNVQWPPNQLWTAEYQRSVVGRKTKPMIGQRMLSKTPRNQWVKNQRTATTNRGAARASRVMIQGIGQILPWFFTAISPALFVRDKDHLPCTPSIN